MCLPDILFTLSWVLSLEVISFFFIIFMFLILMSSQSKIVFE